MKHPLKDSPARHSLAAVATLLLGGLLFGCSAGSVPVGEPPLGVVPTIASPDQVVLPIASHLPSVDQSVAIMQQALRLYNDCLGGAVPEAKFAVAGAGADGTVDLGTAIGALAGLIGGSLGLLAVIASSLALHWTALMASWVVFASPGIGAAVGLLAALYPAWKASRINPIEALRR